MKLRMADFCQYDTLPMFRVAISVKIEEGAFLPLPFIFFLSLQFLVFRSRRYQKKYIPLLHHQPSRLNHNPFHLKRIVCVYLPRFTPNAEFNKLYKSSGPQPLRQDLDQSFNDKDVSLYLMTDCSPH